jgi:ABC-type transporter Mla MlaB component
MSSGRRGGLITTMASGTPATIEFAIWAPLRRSDLPGLCERVCGLLEAGDPVIAFCDVGQIESVDAVTVDALARLQLAGLQRGCQIRLRHASEALRQLVWLMGLEAVLLGA